MRTKGKTSNESWKHGEKKDGKQSKNSQIARSSTRPDHTTVDNSVRDRLLLGNLTTSMTSASVQLLDRGVNRNVGRVTV